MNDREDRAESVADLWLTCLSPVHEPSQPRAPTDLASQPALRQLDASGHLLTRARLAVSE